MLCPNCGKSIDNISQVVSLCASCQESQPKKGLNGGPSTVQEEISLVSKCFTDIELDPAGFWLRVCATIIDGAVMYVLFILISLGMVANLGALLLFSPTNMLFSIIIGVLSIIITLLIVAFLLPALLESSKIQGTIGKHLIGLRVVNEDGSRIGILKALLRSFIRFLTSVFLSIGFIPAGLTQKKQAVHDIMCGTLVIKHKKVSPGKLFTYVLLSLIITGIGSYFSRTVKEHRQQQSSDSVSKLGTGLGNLKKSIEKLEQSIHDKSLPKSELPAITPVYSAPSPVSSLETIPPAIQADPKSTPKAILDESNLSEFDRRVLKNKRLRESGGEK